MTTFLLIRHAEHDLVGKALASRVPGVHLNARGEREADELVQRLAGTAINVLYSSPRERAQQTAAPLVTGRGLSLQVRAGLDDIDFGAWSGRTFAELEGDPQWPLWCERRTSAQPPGGETIMQVQARIVGELEELARLHPDETVALFSHCDVIKAALAHFLHLHLDDLETFEISPASISEVRIGPSWSKVWRVNDTGCR